MDNALTVKRQTIVGRTADMMMFPVMQLLSGSWQEMPQRTHYWNNQKLPVGYRDRLVKELMVQVPGNPIAPQRWLLGFPLFHAPIFGGWKEYVVLEPWRSSDAWHVGWMTQSLFGVSKVPVSGPVRTLIGPEDVHFFGIDSKGKQCFVRITGKGRVGDKSVYQKMPLF